jgi:hypothetical protein
MADIKILKLVTGESIICKLITTNDLNISLEGFDPKTFVLVSKTSYISKQFSQEDYYHKIELQDWLPETEDDIIVIPRNKILTIMNPSKDVLGVYLSIIDEEDITTSTNNQKDIESKNILMKHKFNDDEVQ